MPMPLQRHRLAQVRAIPQRLLPLAIALLLMLPACNADDRGSEPVALYLTWQRDPTTTMTIDWHTRGTRGDERATDFAYRPADAQTWQHADDEPATFAFPWSDNRFIHRVEMRNLQPDTEYVFRPGASVRTYRFRTMPADLTEPIRIVIGGDTMHHKAWMQRMNRRAAEHAPHFIVWGGDLAYGDAEPRSASRWVAWFDAVTRTLIDEDGRVIPIVVSLGNHDVRNGYWRRDRSPTDAERRRQAPYFFTFFAFPHLPGYGVLDFGDYLSLVILDTDHVNPIAGRQTSWLAETLAQRQAVPHILPVYHVTAYPSAKSYTAPTSRRVREHFSPLFEQHRLPLAFENNDHTYKRTVPIRSEQPAESGEGVVYIGDGAWGVRTREVYDPQATWYLEEARGTQHFLLITLDREQARVQAIDPQGDIIDVTERPAR